MKTLLRFLQNGKTQFHVAALAKEYLDAHNFTQIRPRKSRRACRRQILPRPIFFDCDSIYQRQADHTVSYRLRPYRFPDAEVKAEPGIKKAGISANKRGTIRWTYQGNMV